MESAVTFADGTQSHIHGLLNEVSFVVCGALDENESLDKRLVASALVMHAEAPKQRKRGTLDELVLAAAPFRDLDPSMWRAVEQVKAHGVADTPVVEILAPAVHLRGCDLRRIVDERGHHSRLVHAGIPECSGEFMVSSKTLA